MVSFDWLIGIKSAITCIFIGWFLPRWQGRIALLLECRTGENLQGKGNVEGQCVTRLSCCSIVACVASGLQATQSQHNTSLKKIWDSAELITPNQFLVIIGLFLERWINGVVSEEAAVLNGCGGVGGGVGKREVGKRVGWGVVHNNLVW